MSNVVAIDTNSATALDRIVAAIAEQATNMVKGAHRIGTLLNEARDILGDDAAFGAWREEHITEPMGISTRTAQRMQNIAERFTPETLPSVGLSVLYTIASDSVQPTLQEGLIELAEVRARSGRTLTAREASGFVAKVNQGRLTGFDVKQQAIDEATQAKVEVDVNLPEFVGENEAAVGGDEQVGPRRVAEVPAAVPGRVPAPVAPRDWEAEAREYATSVRKKLKGVSNANRGLFLFELRRELEAHGLLEVDEGVTVTVNGKLSFTSK